MRNPEAIECIELMVPLCDIVSDRIARYSMSRESVCLNDDHLDLLLMPIFQIGELIGGGGYLDALQELYPSDMWVQAYGYAKLKPAIVWETAITSIPALRELCLRLLED